MYLMNWGLKPRSRKLIACMGILIMLFSVMGLGNPDTSWAAEPVPAAIEIIGADSIEVKLSGDASATYTATVKDQDGNVMADQTISWLLKETVSGVSIAAENGTVTVADTTVAESFTLVAASATATNVKAEKTVTLTQEENEPPVTVEVTYIATGEITAIAPATVTFADGKFIVPPSVSEFTFKDGDKKMKATFADDTWSLAEVITPPTGCTIIFSVTGGNGTLTATVDDIAINSGDGVEAGKSVVFTATPAAGYQVNEWTVGGQAVADNKTNTLTVEDLAADTTVTVGIQFGSSEGATITGGDTISASGTYNVAANATGTITIAGGLSVTLLGSGTANPANTELFIDCGPGVTLTIQDLCVTNSNEMNLLNFSGSGNKLLLAGVNVLEGIEYNSKAVIHVGPATELTIDGADADGTMYLYKYTAGAGIGGDIHEANGKINLAGGNLFIKGSKTGAVIGNDTCGDEAKEAQIGDITISGGRIYIEANARGAAIGGSSMSAGGNVCMSGGMLTIYVDWTGSAIGAGASEYATEDANCGHLIITGGSLKVFVNQNAAYDWGLTAALACDNPLTAAKLNALPDGAAVYRYMLDVSDIAPNANGNYAVIVDDAAYYSGGLHDYEYTASQESTMANWTKSNADPHIYLYLTLGAHTVSVNGQFLGSINVVEPNYSSDTVEIPAAQWSDASDTGWYTANPNAASFEIATAAELAGLAAIVNAGTDDFSGKTVTLTEEVNLSEREWSTIGRYNYESATGPAFSGIFDGGRKAISGLLLGDADSYYQGLFGNVAGATLKNIIVAGGYITGYEYLGGVAGRAVNSGITGCDNGVTVFGVYKKPGGNQRIGGDYCGGIIGIGENCAIADCRNNGSIGGLRNTAGIAGELSGGSVSNCVNRHECFSLWEGVAGIVSLSDGTVISNCRNEADLSGQTAGGITMGGASQISKCSNRGNLSGCKIGGGITAFLTDSGVVSQCFNSGAITATSGSGRGIGGIVGLLGGNQNTSTIVTDCYNTGAVGNQGAADTDAGGIVGEMTMASGSHYIVANCYSSGAVSTSVADTYAGGIIGNIYHVLYQYTELEIVNNYYLAGSAADGIVGTEPEEGGWIGKKVDHAYSAEAKTAAELRQLSADLGASYADDDEAGPVNGGYPVLRWQRGLEQPTCAVTFSVNVETALVTVTDAAGAPVAPASGVYSLIAGDIYSYTVAAAGYKTSSGTVFPNGNQEISVALTALEDPGAVVYGDINGDGSINSQDVVLLRKHVANLNVLAEEQLAAADVNKDGAVNSQDITMLRRYVANIITSLD